MQELKHLVYSEDPLWQRINDFNPDDPEAEMPFSRKLTMAQNWSETFTQKAIQEYKHFVYLCCVSPAGASPSEIVDKVWHLHLQYTQNYWEAFCEKTLGRNLHHHPSKGGPHEEKKYKHWLKDTLRNYKRVFKKDPPADIWKRCYPLGLPRNRATTFKGWSLVFLFFAAIVMLSGCRANAMVIIILVLFGFFALIILSDLVSTRVKGTDNRCNSDRCGDRCGG
ncbi:glycine-rich domain-containing protein [Chitinophaga nivalis]|uniref:Uncharacterized protein n=1 Tax=Chitinophaga nivalis TaxID=2991709 RepID=A0ABT3IM09_9BACT|nr:hypothetical protein [Chitinophaga nivalis]MCW3465295.1 hypothetical protein [Chitinophaga nivalis]MCW3485013.1 hypothetical protein [Chitinophaga nivalis]